MSEIKEEQLSLGQKVGEEVKGQKQQGKTKKEAKKEKKEERYTGQLIFVSGPTQTPCNLDQAFATNDDYKINAGATKAMIKNIAKNVFMELTRPEVDIVIVEHEGQQYCYLQNTLSKKGSYFIEDGPQIIIQDKVIPFTEIEDYFRYVYEKGKTEARALVYFHKGMDSYLVVVPEEQSKSAVHITNNFDYCLNGNPNIYLAADLHSHHVMGNEFSKTDDEDESGKIGMLFGVYSFEHGWNFRVWKYVDPEDKEKISIFYHALDDKNYLETYRGFSGAASLGE